MTSQTKIKTFLAGKRFAVVGASTDRSKYGNKVLRVTSRTTSKSFQSTPRPAKSKVSPHIRISRPRLASSTAFRSSLRRQSPSASSTTPSALGIKNIWMQPGAESDSAIQAAEAAGANVIAHGPCILVSLRYHDDE